jgi:amino acid permease
MMGSTTLLIPVIFAEIGIFTGILTLFVLAAVNFSTAELLVIHGKAYETDLSEMIERILGRTHFRLFCLISALLMFIVSVVFFLL